jgi:hypothetical protein
MGTRLLRQAFSLFWLPRPRVRWTRGAGRADRSGAGGRPFSLRPTASGSTRIGKPLASGKKIRPCVYLFGSECISADPQCVCAFLFFFLKGNGVCSAFTL